MFCYTVNEYKIIYTQKIRSVTFNTPHTETKTNNYLPLLTINVCQSVSPGSAIDLHCCSKTTKKTSQKNTTALGDMFPHSETSDLDIFKNIHRSCPCTKAVKSYGCSEPFKKYVGLVFWNEETSPSALVCLTNVFSIAFEQQWRSMAQTISVSSSDKC